MLNSTLIVILCCAFSLVLAFLLFFAFYSRSIEPFDEMKLIPVCRANEELGGSTKRGGDGNLYIIKDNELVCISSPGNQSGKHYKNTLSGQNQVVRCKDVTIDKKLGGDGRLWGVEKHRPCVF